MVNKNLILNEGTWIHSLLNWFLRHRGIRINGGYLGKGTSLGAKEIKIGYGTRINGKLIAKGNASISIGKYCAIGDDVRIISSNHKLNVASLQLAFQKKVTGSIHVMKEKTNVRINHDVWIGDSVIILPGIEIGSGAIVGAGAVVTKSVEPYTVVAGNPAKFIKRRFSPVISDAFLELQWWNMSNNQLEAIRNLFEIDYSEVDEGHAAVLIRDGMKNHVE